MHVVFLCFFFFKQKTAYEMRISDWSSDVCSSDLTPSQGSSALWLTVKNRSRTKIEGVQTHLTRVEPEVPAFPVQALPPFELSTKGALEAHRSQTQAPLSVDFVLAAGATDKFEIASLASDGALGWCVTHPAGESGRASCRESGGKYV